MRLLSVKIEGFRNIEKDVLMFGSGITSLVSTNSYGKSNLMKAIEFSVEFIKADDDVKESMMAWPYGIPFNRYVDSHNFVADFIFTTEIDSKTYYVNYGYEFVWIKNEGGKKIIGEWLNVREEGKSQKFTKLISRAEKAFYKSSPSGRCSSIIKVSDNELVVNRLLFEEGLFYNGLIEKLNHVKVHLEQHLDASDLYLIDPIVWKDQDEFDLSNISNVPRTIFRLKKRHPEKYAILKSAFVQLFPNITEIDVKEIDIGEQHDIKISRNAPYTISNKVYSLFVQDRNLNQPLDFRSLSDGAKRVFMTRSSNALSLTRRFQKISEK